MRAKNLLLLDLMLLTGLLACNSKSQKFCHGDEGALSAVEVPTSDSDVSAAPNVTIETPEDAAVASTPTAETTAPLAPEVQAATSHPELSSAKTTFDKGAHSAEVDAAKYTLSKADDGGLKLEIDPASLPADFTSWSEEKQRVFREQLLAVALDQKGGEMKLFPAVPSASQSVGGNGFGLTYDEAVLAYDYFVSCVYSWYCYAGTPYESYWIYVYTGVVVPPNASATAAAATASVSAAHAAWLACVYSWYCYAGTAYENYYWACYSYGVCPPGPPPPAPQ